jgi:hypothetical protein
VIRKHLITAWWLFISLYYAVVVFGGGEPMRVSALFMVIGIGGFLLATKGRSK